MRFEIIDVQNPIAEPFVQKKSTCRAILQKYWSLVELLMWFAGKAEVPV